VPGPGLPGGVDRTHRAFRILEVLADGTAPLGVSEVARRAGMPKTTTARMLTELTSATIVERIGLRYIPGPRLVAMVNRIMSAGMEDVRRLLLPYLVQLHDLTGLEVALATMRYDRVHFVEVLYGQVRADTLSTLPVWAPAHCTCSGKALLAFNRSRTVLGPFTAYTSKTITDQAALARELWRTRREGVAYNNGEYVAGLSSMAGPVFGRNSSALAAIAVCGTVDDFDLPEARAALRHVTRAATVALRQM
jgi:DNA-binding IclR family transcriptional regulator